MDLFASGVKHAVMIMHKEDRMSTVYCAFCQNNKNPVEFFTRGLLFKSRFAWIVSACQTEPFLYVGPKNSLYHAEIVTERDLRTLQYVQSQNAYVMPEMHLMEGGMDSLYYQNQGQVVVTNNRSLLTHMLRTTALVNVSSGLFPDILTGQGDIHAIPIQGMKDSITFGYVKRLRGDLPEEAVKFVEYVKEHLK